MYTSLLHGLGRLSIALLLLFALLLQISCSAVPTPEGYALFMGGKRAYKRSGPADGSGNISITLIENNEKSFGQAMTAVTTTAAAVAATEALKATEATKQVASREATKVTNAKTAADVTKTVSGHKLEATNAALGAGAEVAPVTVSPP